MRFLLKPKSKLFFRLIASFVLVVVLLQATVGPIGAQQTYKSPNQATTQTTPTQTVQNKLPQTTNTATDSAGQVLGIPGLDFLPNPLDVGKCIANPVQCAIDKAKGAAGDVVGGLLGSIKEIVLSVIKWSLIFVLKIVVSILGFGSNLYGTACNTILDAFREIAFNDPHENQIAQHFNVFVLMDAGYSSMYGSFPKNTTVNNLASLFQQNVLGIQTARAATGTELLGIMVKSFWERFRDIAIIFMVIALVGIGLMVMLRRRLDPRTVVTATNSLPRFAIALILIFFSFVISGLFIDLVNISVALVQNVTRTILAGGAFALVSNALGGELFWFPVFAIFSGATMINWGAFFCTSGIVGSVGLLAGPLGLFVIPVIIMVVETILRLILFLLAAYIFWILVKNYALMVLYTIFSPLFFLLGAVPGFEKITVNWFKRMFVYALLFPTVLLFIYLGMGLLFMSNPFLQILGEGAPKAPVPIQTTVISIPYLLGMGILFYTTKLPKLLEKTFKLDDFDIRGGLSPTMLVTAPIAAGMMAKKGVGPVSTAAGMAVSRGPDSRIARMAAPIYDFSRVLTGANKRFDSSGDPNKFYKRSSGEIFEKQYNTKNAAGVDVRKGYDAHAIAQQTAQTAKERFIEQHITNTPGATREDAVRFYGKWSTDSLRSFAPPSLRPTRTAADYAKDADRRLTDKAAELHASGLSSGEVNQKMEEFIKNGYR